MVLIFRTCTDDQFSITIWPYWDGRSRIAELQIATDHSRLILTGAGQNVRDLLDENVPQLTRTNVASDRGKYQGLGRMQVFREEVRDSDR